MPETSPSLQPLRVEMSQKPRTPRAQCTHGHELPYHPEGPNALKTRSRLTGQEHTLAKPRVAPSPSDRATVGSAAVSDATTGDGTCRPRVLDGVFPPQIGRVEKRRRRAREEQSVVPLPAACSTHLLRRDFIGCCITLTSRVCPRCRNNTRWTHGRYGGGSAIPQTLLRERLRNDPPPPGSRAPGT